MNRISTSSLTCIWVGVMAIAVNAVRLGAQPVPVSIAAGAGQITVSWPAGLSLVQPQKATRIINPDWADWGAATTGLTLTDASGDTAAFYRLRFLAPTVTVPPAGAATAVGSNVSFVVTATGTTPFAYQWQQDNQALSGATAATLTLTNLSLTDAGDYTVVIANRAGAITSAVAVLTVTNLPVRPAGIYMGVFAGEADSGGFAILLRTNGLGYVVGYNGVQQDGVFATNFPVVLDGSFATGVQGGGTVGGIFTADQVSGSFTNSLGQTGTYTGGRKPDTGSHTADAGWYVGTYDGAFTGTTFIVVAADGTAFFYTIDFNGTPGENDGGGFGSINGSNGFGATTVPDNLTVVGTLNPTTHVISGTYKSGNTTLGNFTATRTLTP